jgi:serine/threonine protein kinase
MAIRRLLRGGLSEAELEAVAREAVARQDTRFESVRPLEADNWLSTPAVVNEALFLKIITRQNTILQGLLTTGRNLGAFSSGNEAFFQRFDTPLAMAEHELDATREMRDIGVNAPEPLEAFEHEEYGVLVLEFLPEFETLGELDGAAAERAASDLFAALARMHEAGLAHGDLRGENVLVADGDLYFIDATNVREAAIDQARAYDVACALAALEPLVGATTAVAAAAEYNPGEVLLAAEQYLGFVNLRPDHTFEALSLRGEIEKTVQSSASR